MQWIFSLKCRSCSTGRDFWERLSMNEGASSSPVCEDNGLLTFITAVFMFLHWGYICVGFVLACLKFKVQLKFKFRWLLSWLWLLSMVLISNWNNANDYSSHCCCIHTVCVCVCVFQRCWNKNREFKLSHIKVNTVLIWRGNSCCLMFISDCVY